jgi:hypothetical protein
MRNLLSLSLNHGIRIVTKTTLSYCHRNGSTPSYPTPAHKAINATSLPSFLVFLVSQWHAEEKGGGGEGQISTTGKGLGCTYLSLFQCCGSVSEFGSGLVQRGTRIRIANPDSDPGG